MFLGAIIIIAIRARNMKKLCLSMNHSKIIWILPESSLLEHSMLKMSHFILKQSEVIARDIVGLITRLFTKTLPSHYISMQRKIDYFLEPEFIPKWNDTEETKCVGERHIFSYMHMRKK